MPNSGTPEPPHRRQLAELLAQQQQATAAVNEVRLTMTDDSGLPVVAPLGSHKWQPLAGREGVQIYHVPDPSGAPGLFLTVCVTEPGSQYQGSRIDESRLLGLLEGELELNGRRYTPGQFLWLAPGEPSSWRSQIGSLCVVRYDVPPPDLDLSDIIIPLKP
jgi:hypothetical protein